jgi:PAS domain S-box-containing protein
MVGELHPPGASLMSDDRTFGTRIEGRVLLVDDEKQIRDAYSRVLRKLGCTVETASSAVVAFELLRVAPFDLIVTDIGMTAMSGTQFLRALRERGFDVPVILMTGHPEVATAVEAVDSGAFRYLTKPIDLGVFKESVRGALHKHVLAQVLADHVPLLEACRRIARATCQNLGWDFATIWTPDAAGGCLRAAETWALVGNDAPSFEVVTKATALARGQELPGRAWERGSPDWLSDVYADASFSRAPQAHAAGLRSALAVPFGAEGEVFAVVELFSRKEHAPDLALMDLFAASGEQLGARVLRERADRRAVQAETAERSVSGTLNAIMECAPVFILAVDATGAIQFINRVVPGYDRQQVVGSNWLLYMPPSDHDVHRTHLERVLRTGTAETYETIVLGPEGTKLWFSTHMGPLRDQDRVVVVVIVAQDVTELKRTQVEYAAAQRLASLGTIAAGVAHEVNTPVQFVADSVQFLRDAAQDVFGVLETLQTVCRLVTEGAPPDALAEATKAAAEREEEADLAYLHENVPKAFARCLDGLDRISTIVRSMKEFAHPAQHGMAPVDLNRALQSTLTIARTEYKYVAELETDFGELPPVTCHVNDINQVVLNLVVNAAHAIGDIVKGSDNKGAITVRTRQDGDHVVISVADTGTGIPEAIAHRVFEPFFTTKGRGQRHRAGPRARLGRGEGEARRRADLREHRRRRYDVPGEDPHRREGRPSRSRSPRRGASRPTSRLSPRDGGRGFDRAGSAVACAISWPRSPIVILRVPVRKWVLHSARSGNSPGIQRWARFAGNARCSGPRGVFDVSVPLSSKVARIRRPCLSPVPAISSTSPRSQLAAMENRLENPTRLRRKFARLGLPLRPRPGCARAGGRAGRGAP